MITVTTGETTGTPIVIAATARRVDGKPESRRELQLTSGAPAEVALGEGIWEIALTSPEWWAAPVYASDAEALMITAWRRGSISGTLGSKSPPSDELIVNFAAAKDEAGPAGVAVCRTQNREWSCSLPAGEHDLRFSLSGFATEFRWGVKVEADHPTSIGRLDFTPGSSLFGKIQLRHRGVADLLRTAEVSLVPVNPDLRHKTRRYIAKPDARGFFQVRGLVPGEYVLRAETKELIAARRTIQIVGGTNASLREPLVLAKPSRVSLSITPPVDEGRNRWQVELVRKEEGADRIETIDRSLASRTGTWSFHRAIPGDYYLQIGQQDGSEWKTEPLSIRSEDDDVALDVALTTAQVTGTVTMGDRPVAARIRFGGERGRALVADERGRFHGAIPATNDEKTTLVITSDTPHIQRTLTMAGDRQPDGTLHFDIRLPATAILGRLINEDGSPESSGIVTLRSADQSFFEQMFAEQDGSFQFEGFEPGRYLLQADAFQKASAVTAVQVSSGTTDTIDLVLRPEVRVHGEVRMGEVAVSGATIFALPRNVATSTIPSATSDATGQFFLRLPPGVTSYDVVAIPRGFYVSAARVTWQPRQFLRIGVGQDGGRLEIDAPDGELPSLVHAGGEFPLLLVARESGGTVTSAKGRQHFTVPNLEPGTYSVCVRSGCKAVFVPRFASASVTIGR